MSNNWTETDREEELSEFDRAVKDVCRAVAGYVGQHIPGILPGPDSGYLLGEDVRAFMHSREHQEAYRTIEQHGDEMDRWHARHLDVDDESWAGEVYADARWVATVYEDETQFSLRIVHRILERSDETDRR